MVEVNLDNHLNHRHQEEWRQIGKTIKTLMDLCGRWTQDSSSSSSSTQIKIKVETADF